MPVKRAIECLLIAALLAVGGAATTYAQASDEALLEAATAAFEAWAQANEIPYKDLAAEVQSQDDYFATV